MKITKIPFFKTSIVLLLSCLFSLSLLLVRMFYSQSIFYGFLVWNLFLAFLPYLFSQLIYYRYASKDKIRYGFYILIFIWLLFLPNSFYILTDFIHLRLRNNVPIWYDLIMLLNFTWNGLMFGFLSTKLIHDLMDKFFNKIISWILVLICFFLSGFGIYLGRFLRWNSWDLISNPHKLIIDILNRIVYPFHHPRTWSMTIILGIFFTLFYIIVFKTDINKNNKNQ